MKKFISKTFIISLVAFMGLTLCMSGVSAKEESRVTPEFVEYITDAFETKEKVTVTDNNGEDITDVFFEQTTTDYQNKDYLAIKEFVENNVDTICIDNSYTNNINSRSPFVDQVVNKRYYQTIQKAQASGEVVYYIQGSLVWDRATGKITSVSKTTLDVTSINFGYQWQSSLYGISTSSSITSDKYYAKFSVQFGIRTQFYQGYVLVFDVDCGKISKTATVSPEG